MLLSYYLWPGRPEGHQYNIVAKPCNYTVTWRSGAQKYFLPRWICLFFYITTTAKWLVSLSWFDSIRSDSIWIKFGRAAIKSFHPYSSKTEAKQEVSRPGCWKSLVITLYRPNSTSDPGVSTPRECFGVMRHRAAFRGVTVAPPLTLYSLGGSMLLTFTQVLWRGTLSETTECHMSIYFITVGQKNPAIPIIRTKGWILASIIGRADYWSVPYWLKKQSHFSDYSLFKCEYFSVSFLPCDCKLNVTVLWTQQDIWGSWSRALRNTNRLFFKTSN